jgi:hypothetical protein
MQIPQINPLFSGKYFIQKYIGNRKIIPVKYAAITKNITKR